MKTIVIIASTLLLLLCNWAQAIVPINKSDVTLVKLVDLNHITKGETSSQSQIINLIEDLDIDSEEDNSKINDLKLNKDNKYLSTNFSFLSIQDGNCLFNHKTIYYNNYYYFPSLFGNSNPIYILINDLRI